MSRALAIIGDRWALRILGASFAGPRRFEELQVRLGAARSTLTSRLGCLVGSGVLERVRYSDAPPRCEYRLSPQGAELLGVKLLWERAPGAKLVCEHCGGAVTFHNTHYEIVAARAAHTPPIANFRRLSSVPDTAADAGTAFEHLSDIIGDRWTLLVLCAGFLGLRRFDDIQSTLHIATNILTHRLNRLVASGLFRRRLYSQHPPRCEYQLTQQGLDLFPVAVLLTQWGDRWLAPGGGGNLRLFHKDCGQRLHAIVTCRHGATARCRRKPQRR